MDKQNHYKIKIVPLVFAIIILAIGFILQPILSAKTAEKRTETEEKYTGIVEGERTEDCRDYGNGEYCDPAIKYEVDGEEYTLLINPDYADKDHPNRIRYNINDPEDAFMDREDWITTYFDEFNDNYYTNQVLTACIVLAIILLIRAFTGYFFDNIIQNMRNQRADIKDAKKH